MINYYFTFLVVAINFSSIKAGPGSSEIDWKGNNWALGCDFPGHDFKQVSMPDSGDKCGSVCAGEDQ
ncbi:hypothetical protein HDU92_007729, partial [Lobulomyces angularis]